MFIINLTLGTPPLLFFNDPLCLWPI